MIIKVKELKEIIRHIVNEQIGSFAQRNSDIQDDLRSSIPKPWNSNKKTGIRRSKEDDYKEINQYYSFLFRSNFQSPVAPGEGLKVNKVISFLRREFAGSDRSADAEVLIDKDKKNIYVSFKIFVETEKEVNDILHMLAGNMVHNFDLSLINIGVTGKKELELGLEQVFPEFPIS